MARNVELLPASRAHQQREVGEQSEPDEEENHVHYVKREVILRIKKACKNGGCSLFQPKSRAQSVCGGNM